jgi:DNA-directed RNA polymerase subunit beta
MMNAAFLKTDIYSRLRDLLLRKTIAAAPKETGFKKGDTISAGDLDAVTKRGLWRQIAITDETVMAEIEMMSKTFDEAVDNLKERFESPKLKNCSVGMNCPQAL